MPGQLGKVGLLEVPLLEEAEVRCVVCIGCVCAMFLIVSHGPPDGGGRKREEGIDRSVK